jgi:hypothetical protein
MVYSGLLRRVALVRTDVSEVPGASFIRVTRIGELGTTQAATSNRRMLPMVFLRSVRRLLVTACVVPSSSILVTLMMEALSSSETSVLTRVTRRKNSEDTILHSHRRENLKFYKDVSVHNLGTEKTCMGVEAGSTHSQKYWVSIATGSASVVLRSGGRHPKPSTSEGCTPSSQTFKFYHPFASSTTEHRHALRRWGFVDFRQKQTHSVAFSPQANYTD